MSDLQRGEWLQLPGTHPGSKQLSRTEINKRRSLRHLSRAQRRTLSRKRAEIAGDEWCMREDHYYVGVAAGGRFWWELRGPALDALEQKQRDIDELCRTYPNM